MRLSLQSLPLKLGPKFGQKSDVTTIHVVNGPTFKQVLTSNNFYKNGNVNLRSLFFTDEFREPEKHVRLQGIGFTLRLYDCLGVVLQGEKGQTRKTSVYHFWSDKFRFPNHCMGERSKKAGKPKSLRRIREVLLEDLRQMNRSNILFLTGGRCPVTTSFPKTMERSKRMFQYLQRVASDLNIPTVHLWGLTGAFSDKAEAVTDVVSLPKKREIYVYASGLTRERDVRTAYTDIKVPDNARIIFSDNTTSGPIHYKSYPKMGKT